MSKPQIHDVLIHVAKAGLAEMQKRGQKEAQSFVPMPGGMPAPPPGGAAGGMPMDPAMAGGAAAPPASGMAMDPSMMGGAPMAPPDPASMAAAGMPPPQDPALGGTAVTGINPEMLEAIRQVVREEMGTQSASAPAEGGEKPKSSGKVAIEERLTKIEAQLSQLVTLLGGGGPASGAGAMMPPVPEGEMGAAVPEAPPMEVAAAAMEQPEPEDKVLALAGALSTLRSMGQI